MARGKNVANQTAKAERAVKAQRALELRVAGLSLAQIGAELGVTEKSASRYVCDALTKLSEQSLADAEQLRTLELERLDRLQRAAELVLSRNHVHVSGGKVIVDEGHKLIDDGPVLHAIDRLLRIGERRAKLLGIDAPAKLEHSGPDGGPIKTETRDLSHLSDEELKALDGILAKLESPAEE
jgi:predicted transcriptional regulator